jgi:hypothetical protein
MIHILAAQHPGILHGGTWNGNDSIAVFVIIVLVMVLGALFKRR